MWHIHIDCPGMKSNERMQTGNRREGSEINSHTSTAFDKVPRTLDRKVDICMEKNEAGPLPHHTQNVLERDRGGGCKTLGMY